MLPSTDLKASAPRTIAFSMLNSPAHPYRYRRFACPLAGADARLAEKRGSVTPSFRGTCTPYLLPVRLTHQIPAYALTHRAPPLGLDDEPLDWPRVTDAGLGLSGRRPVPPAGRAPRRRGPLTAGAPCPVNPSPFNPEPRH